jgi:hypothetical protein
LSAAGLGLKGAVAIVRDELEIGIELLRGVTCSRIFGPALS